MALSIVRGLLQQYVQSLFNEGIINDQFSHIQHLKMVGRADHFVQLINTYCLNVETILSKLESYIDLPNVDFSNLAALATEIEERSSCIGAEHVRLTCLDLMRACDQMQKQNFCQALSWTKNEFAHTRNKLQVLVQMERKIMRLEAKQQK
ncbi:PREDICTED: histidine-containing phosphotransfer protein 2-like isoform X7 [Theobroma cacao]|uniref:Histidine-containing phosphotransfer protein n=1 Tax=Theobroma cacao TaxID=3641 RepID=A0AB32WTQ7_THECC|nr:PREDICTED: histidine-containing phosphotransfer protein 2-like isoform X7 [Theobroma cacao]